jgi:hypothetical protein
LGELLINHQAPVTTKTYSSRIIMLLKGFCYNYLMVKSTKKIIDSLQIHGYTYNKFVITPLFNRVSIQLKGGIRNKTIR